MVYFTGFFYRVYLVKPVLQVALEQRELNPAVLPVLGDRLAGLVRGRFALGPEMRHPRGGSSAAGGFLAAARQIFKRLAR